MLVSAGTAGAAGPFCQFARTEAAPRRTPEADLASIGSPTTQRNSHSGAAPQGQGRNSLLTLITRPRLLRSQPRSRPQAAGDVAVVGVDHEELAPGAVLPAQPQVARERVRRGVVFEQPAEEHAGAERVVHPCQRQVGPERPVRRVDPVERDGRLDRHLRQDRDASPAEPSTVVRSPSKYLPRLTATRPLTRRCWPIAYDTWASTKR